VQEQSDACRALAQSRLQALTAMHSLLQRDYGVGDDSVLLNLLSCFTLGSKGD